MSNEFADEFYDESKDNARSGERALAAAIPQRVKSGTADTEALTLEISSGPLRFVWADVELICLGIIKYVKDDGKVPHSKIRKAIRENLFGEDKMEKPPEFLVTNLLDIYIKDHEAPYRIDAASINYKSFLGKVGYVSAINFRRLVKHLCFYAAESLLEPNVTAFLTNKKDRINTYASVYVFQDTCVKLRKGSDKLARRANVPVELEEHTPWGDPGGWD